MANRNTIGRTAANLSMGGALAWVTTAMILPEMGVEVPSGGSEAFTVIFGGILQYIRNIRE